MRTVPQVPYRHIPVYPQPHIHIPVPTHRHVRQVGQRYLLIPMGCAQNLSWGVFSANHGRLVNRENFMNYATYVFLGTYGTGTYLPTYSSELSIKLKAESFSRRSLWLHRASKRFFSWDVDLTYSVLKIDTQVGTHTSPYSRCLPTVLSMSCAQKTVRQISQTILKQYILRYRNKSCFHHGGLGTVQIYMAYGINNSDVRNTNDEIKKIDI